LGTRLGEPTSFWNPAMIPAGGFIHVDIDPEVPGVAYPEALTFPVHADVDAFVSALLEKLPPNISGEAAAYEQPNSSRSDIGPPDAGDVRPEALMAAIQRVAVDNYDCLVMAESGNSFTWATHHLRFTKAGRYRVSTGVGSMGHFSAGVVGAALAGERTAVAIVGDGALLMTN
jgi:acetolactate synthase-1/2/3 large subunit